MKVLPMLITSLLVSAAMLALGLYAAARMPAGAMLPVHWNVTGDADRWQEARDAVWVMPLIAMAVSAVLAMIPRLEPLREQAAASAPVVRVAWAGSLALLALAQAMIVAPAFGRHLPASLLLLAVGGMFLVLSNLLPQSRPGHFIGVRTPWTLADPANWIATHRLAGKGFMLAGLAFVLAGLPATPGPLRLALVVLALLAAGVLPVGYSWYLARKAR